MNSLDPAQAGKDLPQQLHHLASTESNKGGAKGGHVGFIDYRDRLRREYAQLPFLPGGLQAQVFANRVS